MFDLDKVEVSVKCPKCGFENQILLEDVRMERIFLCRGCKVDIQLKDKDKSVETGRKSIDDSLAELKKTLSTPIKLKL